MFKLDITHKNTYSEIPQANPLRWRIMYRKGDTLSSQSGILKCKDFFNDIVAYKKAKLTFSIYSFSNKVKFNRDGLYLHLTDLYNYEKFMENIVVVNNKLQEQLKVGLKLFPINETSAVLCIPHKLWKNTYYISMVSMLIRLCNYNIQYTTWESIFDPAAPINTAESAFSAKAKERALKHGFKLPKALQKFWYWAGVANSGDGKKVIPSVVHNNGVSSWNQWMEKQ